MSQTFRVSARIWVFMCVLHAHLDSLVPSIIWHLEWLGPVIRSTVILNKQKHLTKI